MTLPKAPQRLTPSFAFSFVERSLQEGLANRQFGRPEMEEVIRFFGMVAPECVYCGSREVRRWDHLIPVIKGGETVVGNMVPACARCDDSRQHHPFDAWMGSTARFSPRSFGISDIDHRIERLREYMAQYRYVPRPLEERLQPDEIRRLDEVRERIRVLRSEIDQLIHDYRERRTIIQ